VGRNVAVDDFAETHSHTVPDGRNRELPANASSSEVMYGVACRHQRQRSPGG
jgi:hypothetical protein